MIGVFGYAKPKLSIAVTGIPVGSAVFLRHVVPYDLSLRPNWCSLNLDNRVITIAVNERPRLADHRSIKEGIVWNGIRGNGSAVAATASEERQKHKDSDLHSFWDK
jgi:hypothetical protein